MIYGFGDLELDEERFELRRQGRPLPVEPQVFLVLRELVKGNGRLIGKDQMAQAVWGGSAVSDASIASRIRAARAAIGDDGARQEIIRTVHGRGFQLVAAVRSTQNASGEAGPPSLAVLPFRTLGSRQEDHLIMTEALAHEVLRALSRLRWLTVISRGSSFRFRGAEPELGAIGARLGVRYILTGTAEIAGQRITVSPELVEATSARVLWTDRLSAPLDALAELRQAIVMSVCAALELHVPLNEALLAEGRDFDRLDAWASYHLGLRQMFRFTADSNARAANYFRHAVALNPAFARAHAGLSFTSFQEAFLRYGPDRDRAAEAALGHAERSLELDPLDPFAAFSRGRAHWLTDELETAVGWLTRATDLNPNYAQGYYSRALLDTFLMRKGEADDEVARALRLSPLDPLLYGMFGTRALNLLQQGDHAQAADWSDRAASAPNAHVIIAMIALAANGMADRRARAEDWAARVRRLRPDASAELFFSALPLRDPATRAGVAAELKRSGFA